MGKLAPRSNANYWQPVAWAMLRYSTGPDFSLGLIEVVEVSRTQPGVAPLAPTSLLGHFVGHSPIMKQVSRREAGTCWALPLASAAAEASAKPNSNYLGTYVLTDCG